MTAIESVKVKPESPEVQADIHTHMESTILDYGLLNRIMRCNWETYQEEVQERAAICEYDGGLTRPEAEQLALERLARLISAQYDLYGLNWTHLQRFEEMGLWGAPSRSIELNDLRLDSISNITCERLRAT